MMANDPENPQSKASRGLSSLITNADYRTRVAASNNALRAARTSSDEDMLSADEIVSGSPLIKSLKSELDAAHKQVAMLSDRLEVERATSMANLEKAERDRIEIRETLSEKLRKQQASYEKMLTDFSNAQDKRDAERKQLLETLEADLTSRRNAVEKERTSLKASRLSLDDEMKRFKADVREKLQTSSKTFVSEMIKELNGKSKDFSLISISWSIVGGAILFYSSVFLAVVTYKSFAEVHTDMSWSLLSFYTLKGTILAAVAGAASRYAFVMSKRYMSESLRTDERIHSVKFGQFYVETYGATASWSDVKETFSDWNGTNGWRSRDSEKSNVSEANP